MSFIGVLGGMGPAATVDFMAKLVALTPACCDQDHLPVVVVTLPRVPDRSAAILGRGQDPLPALKEGIALLNRADVGLVVIPCSTSHHWYDELSAASHAPILHIARAAVSRVPRGERALILATRGALASGFFQRELAAWETPFDIPSPDDEQVLVDDCIRLIKSGQPEPAGACLERVLVKARTRGARTAILGCTELPLAAVYAERHSLGLIDCTLELARCAVEYALQRGWNCA
ncbi:aspartate/glutamate racemase family protein [Thiocystis violascens]|uniref:Aspartate racemase n=1 Tax=Thiocystis violascens (strain ATCC 17096 / DSM 198 / 6111) TaxID=765911 RepID=I3YG00_THIV6|nr:amino acid racemase [Thiocystis violascens]AFL75918.1 aspartate racemase [Thiocystis violascens DSM 198]